MEKAAEKIFTNLEDTMIHLYDRWYDEKEFEEILDYSKPIIPEIEKFGGEFLKMYKRPFGFSYKLGDKNYRIKVTDTIYSYEKIK